jgi:two-component system LytT family sensor kinase
VEQHLITLLVRIGVATSIASFGVRSDAVKRMLQREERTLAQRVQLALWFAAIFAPGVLIRVVTGSYPALDLALEGSLLAGITGGYVCGWLAGMMIAIPSMMGHELLSLPFLAAVGLGGGLLRDSASDKEEVWRFSPFPDLNVYRVFQRGRELRSALFHMYFSVAVVGTEFLRELLGTAFPGALFTIARWGDPFLVLVATWASTYFCITLPLKVWANTRSEARLEEQQRLLMQARLEALASQINPHFLFNTLNSVSSLIRVSPEQARTMINRLARIMRGRLRNQDHFAPLREELDFVEDYLSIELVRFGDKLQVVKQIDPSTLDLLVPSMLLQPLIENSIKHGISSKVGGGTITLRTSNLGGRLAVVVEDDGVGIPEAELAGILSRGIGVSNVKERLQVLYRQDYRMTIDSQPGRGTRIEIEIPESRARLAAVS